MVRWNDVPGSPLRARQRNGILVSLDVLRPQFALGVVALADLPLPRRIIEALLEALKLLLRADMEINFTIRVPLCASVFSKSLIIS